MRNRVIHDGASRDRIVPPAMRARGLPVFSDAVAYSRHASVGLRRRPPARARGQRLRRLGPDPVPCRDRAPPRAAHRSRAAPSGRSTGGAPDQFHVRSALASAWPWPCWSSSAPAPGRGGGAPVDAADPDEVRILAGEPSTFDPAAAGDVVTAAVTAQLYETLTAYDAAPHAPAGARGQLGRRRRRDERRLPPPTRPDASPTGRPLTAEDVVGSWLRIIDPLRPAPLAALMIDVRGARDYLAGAIDRSGAGRAAGERPRRRGRAGAAGRRLPGDRLVADLRGGPAGRVARRAGRVRRRRGGERRVRGRGRERGRDHAPAQRPLLGRPAADPDGAPRPRHRRAEPRRGVRGRRLDYTEVSIVDAPWIAYDEQPRAAAARDAVAGAHLRRASTRPARRSTTSGSGRPSVPPSTGDGSRALGVVRRAGAGREHGAARHSAAPATATGCRVHDPDRARALLAEAGYPGGAGLPPIQFAVGGAAHRGRHRGRPRARARDGGRARHPRRPSRPHHAPTRRTCGSAAGSPTTRARTTSSASSSRATARRTTAAGSRRRSTRPSPMRSRRATRRRPRRPSSGPSPRSRTRCRSCRCTSARTGRCRATACSAPADNGMGILRMAGMAWARVSRVAARPRGPACCSS